MKIVLEYNLRNMVDIDEDDEFDELGSWWELYHDKNSSVRYEA